MKGADFDQGLLARVGATVELRNMLAVIRFQSWQMRGTGRDLFSESAFERSEAVNRIG